MPSVIKLSPPDTPVFNVLVTLPPPPPVGVSGAVSTVALVCIDNIVAISLISSLVATAVSPFAIFASTGDVASLVACSLPSMN